MLMFTLLGEKIILETFMNLSSLQTMPTNLIVFIILYPTDQIFFFQDCYLSLGYLLLYIYEDHFI